MALLDAGNEHDSDNDNGIAVMNNTLFSWLLLLWRFCEIPRLQGLSLRRLTARRSRQNTRAVNGKGTICFGLPQVASGNKVETSVCFLAGNSKGGRRFPYREW